MRLQNLLGFGICAFVLLSIAYGFGSALNENMQGAISGAMAGYGVYCLASIVVGIPVGWTILSKNDKLLLIFGIPLVLICGCGFFGLLFLGW